MKAPRFEHWLGGLALLNQPQRRRVQQALLPAAGLDQIITLIDTVKSASQSNSSISNDDSAIYLDMVAIHRRGAGKRLTCGTESKQASISAGLSNSGGKCKFRTCDPCSVNAVLYP